MGEENGRNPAGATGRAQDPPGHPRRESLVKRTLEERNKLVLEFLPLVRFHAERIARSHPISCEDLESHGMIGLIQAAESFDPGKSASAQTWFSLRIVGSILDGIRQHDRCRRSWRKKWKEGGIALPAVFSVDEKVPGCEDRTWADIFHAEDDPTLSAEQDDNLEYLMRGLAPRERLILTLYVRRGWTMDRIARLTKLSMSRVSQIFGRDIIPHVKSRAERAA